MFLGAVKRTSQLIFAVRGISVARKDPLISNDIIDIYSIV